MEAGVRSEGHGPAQSVHFLAVSVRGYALLTFAATVVEVFLGIGSFTLALWPLGVLFLSLLCLWSGVYAWLLLQLLPRMDLDLYHVTLNLDGSLPYVRAEFEYPHGSIADTVWGDPGSPPVL